MRDFVRRYVSLLYCFGIRVRPSDWGTVRFTYTKNAKYEKDANIADNKLNKLYLQRFSPSIYSITYAVKIRALFNFTAVHMAPS